MMAVLCMYLLPTNRMRLLILVLSTRVGQEVAWKLLDGRRNRA